MAPWQAGQPFWGMLLFPQPGLRLTHPGFKTPAAWHCTGEGRSGRHWDAPTETGQPTPGFKPAKERRCNETWGRRKGRLEEALQSSPL